LIKLIFKNASLQNLGGLDPEEDGVPFSYTETTELQVKKNK
jgi:hypothetical protein